MKKLFLIIFVSFFTFYAMEKKNPGKAKTLLGTYSSWKSQKKLTNNYSTIEISIQNKKRELALGKLKKDEYCTAVEDILQKSTLTQKEQIKLALKYKQE